MYNLAKHYYKNCKKSVFKLFKTHLMFFTNCRFKTIFSLEKRKSKVILLVAIYN